VKGLLNVLHCAMQALSNHFALCNLCPCYAIAFAGAKQDIVVQSIRFHFAVAL
jgi:hypothetical protein